MQAGNPCISEASLPLSRQGVGGRKTGVGDQQKSNLDPQAWYSCRLPRLPEERYLEISSSRASMGA